MSDLERQLQTIEELKVTLSEGQNDALDSVANELRKKLETQNIHVEIEDTVSRLDKSLAIGEEIGRPFHILLDQVEETFTRYNPDLENELELFLLEIEQIFEEPSHRPQGKIILSYRKEYHPEIEELCKKLQIPREGVFLKKLDQEDIIDVVKGITNTERLRQRYKITVENGLPIIIADDLLEDKESPIAPVLSILLTKLYDLAQKEETTELTIDQYQKLKKEGILMADFFHQQMEKVRIWKPEIVESGLALDILNFHTTALGTAGSQAIEQLRQRYEHHGDLIDKIIDRFQQFYLLTDAGKGQTGLAHDTLAPIVIREARESDKLGQRALRILTGKINEFKNDETHVLDEFDLHFVEEGKEGMRLWSELEEKLVAGSIRRRTKNRRLRRMRIILGAIAIIFLIGMGVFSTYSFIGQIEAEAKEDLLELEGMELRVEAILNAKAYPDSLFIEMDRVIDELSEGNLLKEYFIDDTEILQHKNKLDSLKDVASEFLN